MKRKREDQEQKHSNRLPTKVQAYLLPHTKVQGYLKKKSEQQRESRNLEICDLLETLLPRCLHPTVLQYENVAAFPFTLSLPYKLELHALESRSQKLSSKSFIMPMKQEWV